jgi:hypothetical protein
MAHGYNPLDLETFRPPLMSSAIQLTIANIIYDRVLGCKNQLHYQDMGRKESFFQQILRRSNGDKGKVLKLE